MIPLHKVLIASNALEHINKTLFSGLITEGPRVIEFEEELGKYLGSKILATNSCTSSLSLALHLCDVQKGDDVVTTPMTCAATNTHIILRGAKPVWADIDTQTGHITPESIARRVTEKTKAIMVVDWGGRVVNCEMIRESVVEAHGRCIPIICDAAHSFGATMRGVPVNATAESADYVCYSFQAIKHLTTGDGGAIKVPEYQFKRARAIRWFGIDRETKAQFRFLQDIPEAGYKYHMNDLTASLGLANLPVAKMAVEQHRKNAEKLYDRLSGKLSKVKLPPFDKDSSWWFFSILTQNWLEFVSFASSRGVGAGPVHGRNDEYSGHGKSDVPLPGVDYYASRHVAVPCGWWIGDQELDQIASVVIEWDRK